MFQISPFIRNNISRPILKSLTKSGSLSIDYNKALGNVTALYRSALGSNNSEVQIPLPSSEKPRFRPEDLTDVEIEQAITPVFDFFDANLPTLNTYLSDTTKEMIMTRVWKEILNVVEGLLVPPLSDVASDMKPLTDKEVDIVFKWLKVSLFSAVVSLSPCLIVCTVLEQLLLRWRRGSCSAGNPAKPEIPRRPLDSFVL